MAPLNEEDDEDEDSTVFDIKYRYGAWGRQQLPPGPSGVGVVGWFTLENNARPGVASMCPCSLVMCLTLGRSAYGGNRFDPFLECTAPRKLAEKWLFPLSPNANAGGISFA